MGGKYMGIALRGGGGYHLKKCGVGYGSLTKS